jgi:hypothetical protein
VLDPEFREDVYGEPQRVYFDEETA